LAVTLGGLLADTWKQEWSLLRKGDDCYWLSPGRRIIPIGCYLEAVVESHKEGLIAIGCLIGGLLLLAVTWKQEWSPTRKG
jgi:hypothetical protein